MIRMPNRPIRAEAARSITTSPEHTYAQVIDLASWPRWLPGHGGWPDGPPTTLTQGTQFRLRLGTYGIYDTCLMTVVENTAPSALVLHGTGNHGTDARLSIRVHPEPGGGSQLQITIDALGHPSRAIATLARLGLQRELDTAIAQLAMLALTEQRTSRNGS